MSLWRLQRPLVQGPAWSTLKRWLTTSGKCFLSQLCTGHPQNIALLLVQGSVVTPGGSKRFGSFAGRFALVQANGNGGKVLEDNYGLMAPEDVRAAARKMRIELDNLYKVCDVPCTAALIYCTLLLH